MDCPKVPPSARKGKKKQVKDELDRIKQAEKKKRRLEKALATSAAIRSELEKKKQKKKEEQQRLDEEGAAIAEAVALHVLLGEDSDESCKVMLKDEGLIPWEQPSSFDVTMGGKKALVSHQDLSYHPAEGMGWVSDAHDYRYMTNGWENCGWMITPNPFQGDYHHYFDEGGCETAGMSAGLIAAQAVSSLQIAEDAQVDRYVFNRMLRG